MPSYLYTATDVSQDRTIQKEGHNCGSMWSSKRPNP
jgi:hypothetical protein